MHVDTQFSVFLVNKPGVLAQVTHSLAKAKVNIVALTLMDSSEHGVLRFVSDNAAKAREILRGNSDNWTETEVVALHLKNEPGAFSAVAQKLAEAHVNISYAYTSGGAPGGRTTCILKVADMKKSAKLLSGFNGAEKPLVRRQMANLRRVPAPRGA